MVEVFLVFISVYYVFGLETPLHISGVENSRIQLYKKTPQARLLSSDSTLERRV